MTLDDEAHVWLVRPEAIEGASLLARCERTLDPDELHRLERFHFERDRHLYRVAHTLLRTTLSRYVQISPASWRFRAGRHGRPEVVGPGAPHEIRFSLSHTQGLCACVVTNGVECGLDVELVRDFDNMMEVAAGCCSSDELAALSNAKTTDRARRFSQLWTLKEAYTKARGLGMQLPFQLCAFDLSANEEVAPRFDPALDDRPNSWQFLTTSIAPRHQLAVAIRRQRNDRDRRIALHWAFASAFGGLKGGSPSSGTSR